MRTDWRVVGEGWFGRGGEMRRRKEEEVEFRW